MGSKVKKEKQTDNLPNPDSGNRRDRLRRTLGLMLVLFGMFLSVSFISYLYTWRYDQDKVLKFSWNNFVKANFEVSNWLGTLGAYMSNAFFYWGFGLPSILFVIIFIKLGLDLIRKRSLTPWAVMTRNAIFIIAFMSLLLEFIFRKSDFTWGGAFGESTCFWLTNFFGNSIGILTTSKYRFSLIKVMLLVNSLKCLRSNKLM
jgi:S-DNA-T family DNA segregation ATPase FtsK/SpoIIIE